MFPRKTIATAIAASILFTTGCGGGGGGTPAAPTSLNGTAAAGAPIIGQVTVKGALGNTKSALIEADGTYTVDVTGLTAPYRLRAEGTVGGRTYKLHSYAEAADVGGNVNITPFTDLIIANAARQVAESYFDTGSFNLDPAEIDAQEQALQTKLQNVFSALGINSAIDLLNTTFSANHSGLDAALDIVRVSMDSNTNIATITNLIDNSTIDDSVVDDSLDDAGSLPVSDPTTLANAVSDTVAIANIFTNLATAFANGLPTSTAIQNYFADDFLSWDEGKNQFLTDITTDPNLIGLMFSGVSVELTSATTANATFNFGINGNLFADEIVTWSAVKTAGTTWQLRGDQRIADVSTSYQCSNNVNYQAKSCSFHVNIEDSDFTNNPTTGVAIVSATATIVDGTTGLDKAVVFLDTPTVQQGGEAGYLQIYNNGNYSGDYQPFGTGAGEIDPTALGTTFLAGDTVRIDLYESALDKTNPANPLVVGTPAATYMEFMPYAPELNAANAPYPTATQATLTAAQSYTLGNNLTVSWTLATGTRNSEIALRIWDTNGAGADVWIETFGSTATSTTISWAELSADASSLDPNATSYSTELRVYSENPLTGQSYLTQYFGNISGPAAGGGGSVSSLVCGYESGWDDTADGGMGAPISPNSFADYEAVIADCATAAQFTAADVAGSVFVDTGETTTFNDTSAAGTVNDPDTGVYNDGAGTIINFEWYVEDATCTGCNYSYIVIYSDSTIDVNVPSGVWFRETSVLTGITGTPGVAGSTYAFTKYSEQSNYSDTVRATGTDGEIWVGYGTLQ